MGEGDHALFVEAKCRPLIVYPGMFYMTISVIHMLIVNIVFKHIYYSNFDCFTYWSKKRIFPLTSPVVFIVSSYSGCSRKMLGVHSNPLVWSVHWSVCCQFRCSKWDFCHFLGNQLLSNILTVNKRLW